MTDEIIKPEDFETNLPLLSSERLCDVIIAQRYLGIMENEAILSMKELAKRRAAGDAFEFEKYIKIKYDELPKLSVDMQSLLGGGMLGGMFSIMSNLKKK